MGPDALDEALERAKDLAETVNERDGDTPECEGGDEGDEDDEEESCVLGTRSAAALPSRQQKDDI